MIIVQKKRAQGYAIPPGGEILWFGLSTNVPEGYEIDTYTKDMFIRGTIPGSVSNSILGTNTHQHDLPDPAAVGNHTHDIGGGSLTAASGSQQSFSTSNIDSSSQGHSHGIPAGVSSSAGAHGHTLGLTNTTNLWPPYRRIYWIKNVSGEELPLPLNGIVMWDSLSANIPADFSVCDGSGGTIDFRSKFVLAPTLDSQVGTPGGSDTHVHTSPSTGSGGSHSHTLGGESSAGDSSTNISGYEGVSVASGGHTHSLSATSPSDAAHTHTMPNTAAGNHLPPYIKLYYIQRVL